MTVLAPVLPLLLRHAMTTDFSRHREDGPFLLDWNRVLPSGYCPPEGGILELRDKRWLRVDSAGGTPGPAGPRPWLPSPDPCRTFPHHLRDMQGAELGHSSCLLLSDGRVVAGGTTYGSSGTVYVWDGLQDLTVLHPGRHGVNFEIVGETAPGELTTSERMGPDSVDIYRFRV